VVCFELRATPAMEAGFTEDVWSLEEFAESLKDKAAGAAA